MEECIICNTITTLQALHCKHKYCILCIKGFLNSNLKCPICRSSIDYNPQEISLSTHKYTHLWLYQGRNDGWWIFDDELQERLSFYHSINSAFIWSLSGQKIRFDVNNMVQENLDTQSVRYIKKIHVSDVNTYLIKGISGIPAKIIE